MALDFQQVRRQVQEMGQNAPQRERELQEKRAQARSLLQSWAEELEHLRRKVQLAAQQHEPNLRCALPVSEALNAHFSLPELPEQATILAADGSQIAPDRHAEVNYCLINVGAIQMRLGSPASPGVAISSRLYYDEGLYTENGMITDASLALMRDLNERARLAELASGASAPVITFTDGPMELWGAREGGASEYQRSMDEYKRVLSRLLELGAITAGYVDKPAANLVVRLLEVAQMQERDLPELKNSFPLRGVADLDLFRFLLEPGERSAVFAMQSRSAANYSGALALHFFYLNVGRLGHPWLARVEMPAWVAQDGCLLDWLHAALVSQCQIMGSRPYPYLLHRAHEAALVSLEEKDQVTQMIVLELRRRGVPVGEQSYKQAAKSLAGQTRYR